MLKRAMGLLVAATLVFGVHVTSFAEEAGAEKEALAEVEAVGAADVLYVNGNIYTVDAAFSKATILGTKADRIVYVGSDAVAAGAFKDENTVVVDLKGKTVIPGLIEGHMHYRSLGETAMQVDIFYQPKEVILARVKEKAESVAAGEWITGWGWNHEIWAVNEWPTKEELDEVAPNNPVVLDRTDGHSIWVNSKALEAGGITVETPDPQGGEILKNADGGILGILTDTAMASIYNEIPEPTLGKMRMAYELADEELLSYGITSLFDAGTSLEDIQLLMHMYESGELKVRAYELLEASSEQDVRYIEAGYQPVQGLYGNRLSVNAVKLYADGSLGSRSALLLEDYADRPEHIGNGRYTEDELFEIVKRTHDEGFQVATHAIGDGGVHMVLNAYEKALAEDADSDHSDHRFRIEHFQISTPEDIPRSVQMGVLAAMQPTHATSDMNMAEDRVGPERIKSSYAWRTVIDDGGIVIGGSDAPVELVNPYHGLYAGVAKTDRFGNPSGGWYPELAMTRQESLRAFTIWAAKGQFEEEIKGSLEVGKLADFVVIDRDIMTCNLADIRETQALTTVIGGEVVFERPITGTSITVMGAALDTDIINENGNLCVPVTHLAQALDAGVGISDDGTTARLIYNGKEIVLVVGETTAFVDGAELTLRVAPQPGGVYVSVRDIADALGLQTNWYKDSQTACISF